MPTKNVSVTLKLVDQWRRPARDIVASATRMTRSFTDLQKSASRLRLGDALKGATAPTRKIVSDLNRMTTAFNNAADAANKMRAALKGSGSGGWTAAEMNRLKALKSLQSQIITQQRRMANPAPIRAPGLAAKLPKPTAAATIRRGASRRADGGRGSAASAEHGGIAALHGAREAIHSIREATTHTLRTAGDLQSEIVFMRLGGRTKAQVEEALKASRDIQQLVPTSTIAENMARISEMVPVFGDFHHAIEVLPKMAEAAAVLKKINPQAADPAYDLAKALELQGVKTTTKEGQDEFFRLIDSFTRAAIITRGKVTAQEFLNFVKYTRGSSRNYTEEFLTGIAPTLIQELGGMQAGTAVKAFGQQFVAGKMSKTALEQLYDLGLLNEDKIIRTKKGRIKGLNPGGVYRWDIAQRDPLKWVQSILMPAFKSHGVTDEQDIAQRLSTLSSRETGQQFINIMARDLARLIKDKEQFAGALKLDQAYKEILNNDYKTNIEALKASFESLVSEAGSPLVKPAIDNMQALAKTLRDFTSWFNGADGTAGHGDGNKRIDGGGAMLSPLETTALVAGGAYALKSRWTRALIGAGIGGAAGGPFGAVAGGTLAGKSWGGAGAKIAATAGASGLLGATARVAGRAVAPAMVAYDALMGIANEFASGPGSTSLFMQNMTKSIREGLADQFRKNENMDQAGRDIGAMVGRGTASGLKEKGPDVQGQSKSIFEQIRQQSTPVGQTIGQALGQGTATGIKTEAPAVENEAKSLFERIRALFASPIKINFELDGSGVGGGGGGGSGGSIQKAALGLVGGGAGGGVAGPAYNGPLTIKPGASSGWSHPALLDAVRAAGGKRVTALNDRYHAGTGSKHASGLAADMTGNPQSLMAGMRRSMGRAGLIEGKDFKVLNEYANPSKRATGGHIHFQFQSRDAADAFRRKMGGSAGGEAPKRKMQDLQEARARGSGPRVASVGDIHIHGVKNGQEAADKVRRELVRAARSSYGDGSYETV